VISLVVGLGNVGPEYVGTRHNVGFEVLDRVARRLEASRRVVDGHSESALVQVEDHQSGGRRVILAWPSTYMNRSGRAVAELLNRLEIGPENCLVVVDDFNLPLGTVRMRQRGSAGGHNGLESIIETLGTEEFPRLRLGIGPPPEGDETVDFVLGRFEKGELDAVKTMLAKAEEAVILVLSRPATDGAEQLNHNPASPE